MTLRFLLALRFFSFVSFASPPSLDSAAALFHQCSCDAPRFTSAAESNSGRRRCESAAAEEAAADSAGRGCAGFLPAGAAPLRLQNVFHRARSICVVGYILFCFCLGHLSSSNPSHSPTSLSILMDFLFLFPVSRLCFLSSL